VTHRGPFQPLPFCDSVILCPSARPLATWERHHQHESPANTLPAWAHAMQSSPAQRVKGFKGHRDRPPNHFNPTGRQQPKCTSLLGSPGDAPVGVVDGHGGGTHIRPPSSQLQDDKTYLLYTTRT